VIVATSFLVVLAACGDHKVPITQQPTRKIDERLIGNWVSRDGAQRIKVRPLNDFTYVISYFGILFRAFHSDIAGLSFINAQDLETSERNYFYVNYRLSDDGQKLYVRIVSNKVVPEATKDSATVQKLLKDNLQNPLLFGNEDEFTKEH
jgi:hypothetical protein